MALLREGRAPAVAGDRAVARDDGWHEARVSLLIKQLRGRRWVRVGFDQVSALAGGVQRGGLTLRRARRRDEAWRRRGLDKHILVALLVAIDLQVERLLANEAILLK